MEDGGPLRIELDSPAGVDIQSEWDQRGPGERDAYLAQLANGGYQVPGRVDLDSSVAPTIGVPLLPAGLAGLPTGRDPPSALRPSFLPDMSAAPVSTSYLPSIAAGSGSGIAAGLGGLLPGLGLGPNLSLNLGATVWNVLWYAALGYALYSGVRHVPRKSEISTALINGGLAGAVMGFASDRARQA